MCRNDLAGHPLQCGFFPNPDPSKIWRGGVPELASRRHIESIAPIVSQALGKAKVTLSEIDGIAVTQGPGLVGSLLVGLSFKNVGHPPCVIRLSRAFEICIPHLFVVLHLFQASLNDRLSLAYYGVNQRETLDPTF
jgi:hypothetical protein